MAKEMSKTILITGATDGIGKLTAEKLVSLGHNVLIHGRSKEKLSDCENAFKQRFSHIENSERLETYCADLSVFSDIEKLSQDILSRHSTLDIIINNAGIYKTNMPITEDDLDVRFVVNTIAPYLLTKNLLPLMNTSGRIVNLSSAAQAPVDLDAFVGKNHLGNQFSVYAQSKLGITMWTMHLSDSLGDESPAIIAVNPGSLLASKMVKEGYGVEGKDLGIGADILVKASLDKVFANASGKYFDNDYESFAEPHAHALNKANCELLVQTMEELLKKF